MDAIFVHRMAPRALCVFFEIVRLRRGTPRNNWLVVFTKNGLKLNEMEKRDNFRMQIVGSTVYLFTFADKGRRWCG